MTQQIPEEDRAGDVRVLLSLTVAWSVLTCALVLTDYRFHLARVNPYLLALIPALPPTVMIVLAVRSRASERNTYLRRYHVGTIIYAACLLGVTVLSALLVSLCIRSFSSAVLVSWLPIVLGLVPAFVLFMPKRMLAGGKLSEVHSPLRVKMVTPQIRRVFRMGALYIVYAVLNFASAVVFDGTNAPTGILAYVVALLPVLPLFGLIPIYNKYMAEEQDEFQRHLFHQSILWALLGALVIASVIGRLQDHALIFHRHPDFFRPYTVFAVFCFLQIEAVFLINAIQAFRVHKQEKKDR